MIVVQIADVLFNPEGGAKGLRFGWKNLILWGMGFVLCRVLLFFDPPCGSSIPVIIFTAICCCAVYGISAILRAGERKNLLKKVLSFPPAPPILFQNFLCSLFLSELCSKRKSETKVLNNKTDVLKKQMRSLRLILRGKRIKKLSGNCFDTNDVKLELSPGNPDTLYCYYVSERYNNFLSGAF